MCKHTLVCISCTSEIRCCKRAKGLRKVGGSYSDTCLLYALTNARRGSWGLTPLVKLGSCHITFTFPVCLFSLFWMGLTSHQHSIGHMATSQLYWWFSSEQYNIISGTNAHPRSVQLKTQHYNKQIQWI
jgi:hypothetical protein